MAHQRLRHLFDLTKAALKWSPAVGIVGLRQVGKTTLAKTVTQQFRGHYVTLDDDASLSLSWDRPVEFLSRNSLLCIDEVQRAPGLFPNIKNMIGTERKPSRFLLTGSIRFTLKKEVKESLTGRIIIFELLPFTLAEAHGQKPSTFLHEIFSLHETSSPDIGNFRKKFQHAMHRLRVTQATSIKRQMLLGGLPIPCFARDAALQRRWFQLYFESLLTRDLALYDERLKRIPYRQGLAALYELASQQQQEVNVSRLVKIMNLSRPLLQLFLSGLEALCLIDFIPAQQRSAKAIKKLQIQWKDIGLWSSLMQVPADQITKNPTAINLLISTEFRAQLQQLSSSTLWQYYRNRDGAAIPWIFQKGPSALAISYVPLEVPRPYDYKILSSFLKDKPGSFAVMLTAGHSEPNVVSRQLVTIPLNMVF